MINGESNGHNLNTEVAQQTKKTKLLTANRGNIFDMDGKPIAVDATSYSLYAVLTDKWSQEHKEQDHVTDINMTAEKLAKHINLSAEDIKKILMQKDVDQVEFGNAGSNLSVQTKQAIDAEKLPGIKFNQSPSRFYPNGIFASHLIGYTDVDTKVDEGIETKVLVGRMGIEAMYDKELSGEDGLMEYLADGKGYPIYGSERVVKEPVSGNNIYLTLDKRLQTYLETLVTEVNQEFDPVSMGAMLVEAKTGNIIAATQRPTFNATTKEGIDNMWNNLLLDEAYEPGSTLKVLTLAAAINEGVFDPNEKFKSGSIKIYDDVVSDYNKVGWGDITYLEGIAHSSNVAFVNLVQKIGIQKWKEYLEDFGFAKSTDSGFKNEVAGINPYESYLQQLSTGFGQGITVTAFQMMQAFTAVANQGEMMKLRFVDRIEKPDGEVVKEIKETKLAHPISPETAKKTLEYLTAATEMAGSTGHNLMIKGEKIATKTGTAELINPETGKYYAFGNNYIYSVVGFTPDSDSEYIFYIFIKQPQNNPRGLPGSKILEHVFNPFMKRVLDSEKLNNKE
ncbi:peptidoglycan D,D-transpeptidase FtsI family protein [Granulicatella balaenopterae]|nr:penicillin-binding protein 2 [Granulicatella balaenopterae]